MSVVLYVEPEEELRMEVGRILSSGRIQLRFAVTMRQAASQLETERFAAVLIEPHLPDGDGLGLALRRQQLGDPTPFVALTSRCRTEDAVAGYSSGVSLYLKKPMDPAETLAHLKAFLRIGGRGKISYHGVRLDRDEQTLTLPDGRSHLLPSQELRFLVHLFTEPDQVASREHVLSLIWPTGAPDNALDVVVYRVREKLGPWHGLVETVRGQGYRLGRPALTNAPRESSSLPRGNKRKRSTQGR